MAAVKGFRLGVENVGTVVEYAGRVGGAVGCEGGVFGMEMVGSMIDKIFYGIASQGVDLGCGQEEEALGFVVYLGGGEWAVT